MVSTIKFSEFANGGNLSNDKITVGLSALPGTNTYFNNPWTFLAPGTTSDRPAPSAAIYFRLRFNTSTEEYEFYDPTSMVWETLVPTTEFSWQVITTSPHQMVTDIGYITNDVTIIDLILPVTSLVGQEIAVVGQGAGGWRISQGANQLIHIGNAVSTTGIIGRVESSNQYDSLRLICITDDLEWTLQSAPQSSGLTII
jgi:hypothetical protein